MKRLIFSGILALVMLAGCSSAPTCDDKNVLELLQKIQLDEINIDSLNGSLLGFFGIKSTNELKFEFSSFMTESSNNNAVLCKAHQIMKKTNGEAISVFGIEASGGMISYSARYTDDGQLYVEILK